MADAMNRRAIRSGFLGAGIAAAWLCGIATSLATTVSTVPIPCTFRAGGFPFVIIVRNGTTVEEYKLVSRDPALRLRPLGYHATAIIECRDCLNGHYLMARFGLSAGTAPSTPTDAVDSVGHPVRWSSWMDRRADWLTRTSSSAVAIGELRGIAERFRADWRGERSHDVIELAVSDGCVSLSAKVETPTAQPDGSDPLGDVRGLLESLVVEAVEPGSTLRAMGGNAEGIARLIRSPRPTNNAMPSFDLFQRELLQGPAGQP